MKTVNAIRAEYAKNRDRIAEIDTMLKGAKPSQIYQDDNFIRAEQERATLKIVNHILHDNARQALFAEVFPVILEVVNSFAGKAYGEKTKEKINRLVKEKTNCACYLERGTYRDTIHFCPLNESGYSDFFYKYGDFIAEPMYIDGKNKRLFDSNKIVKLEVADFEFLGCAPYVENVRERADEIQTAFSTLKKTFNYLNGVIDNYNSLLPSSINKASVYDRNTLRYMNV